MMKVMKAKIWLPVCLLILIFSLIGGSEVTKDLSYVSDVSNSGKLSAVDYSQIISRIEDQGQTTLIVGLKLQTLSERESISDIQQAFLTGFSEHKITNITRFKYTPFLSFSTDLEGFLALLNDPNVVSIERNKSMTPSLTSTISLIGANTVQNLGYTGSGLKVAVLDTGVYKDNPFLTGKVVQEACYSNNGSDGVSLCPGGVTQSTAVDSGVNCDPAWDGTGCWHGTHIAGIIAGKDEAKPLYGVAPDAELISVQVYTFAPSGVRAYQVDVNLGLEHIISLYDGGDHSIAAVNLSLEFNDSANTKYTSQVTCDAAWESTKSLIDALAARNIPVIVASGDGGYTNGLSAPSCISSAISVGASTKKNTISSYTNSASFLDLVAPGHSIYSSWATSYSIASGTSQAAAHVSGAWTLLRQKDPTLTVEEGLAAFRNSAKNITDTRNGVVLKRILVNKAMDQLGPRAAALITPTGGIKTSDRTPTFQWQPVADATSYKIRITQKTNSAVVYENWFTSVELGCDSVSPCEWTPDSNLGVGEMVWMILGRDADMVEGVWSSKASFFIQILPPVLVSPTGGDIEYRPTYLWEEVENADKYLIYAIRVGDTSPTVKLWVGTGDCSCVDGVCSYNPNVYLKSGTYRWYMRSYNTFGGTSAWSKYVTFQTLPKPDAPTLLAPSDTVDTFTPTYTWTQMPRATQYLLYVIDANKKVYIKKWFKEEQLECDGTNCSVTPNISLKGGTYRAYVKASNPAGTSAWSPSIMFTTPPAPDPVTLVGPEGNITPTENVVDWQPTFTWTKSDLAVSYLLYIKNVGNNTVTFKKTLTSSQVSCGEGEETCQYSLAASGITLSAGPYKWWVKAVNPAGSSAWSTGMVFTPPAKPLKVTLVGPSGAIDNWNPTFQWNKSERSTKYYLIIYKTTDSTVVFKKWLTVDELGCGYEGSELCEYSPDYTFSKITYKWRVLAYNPSGKAAYSVLMYFTPPSAPSQVILSSPLGGIKTETNAPYYTWYSNNASSYILLIKDKLTGTIILKKQFDAVDLGCEVNSGTEMCTIHPEVFLVEDREYNWWIRGVNPAGAGTWSNVGLFKAGAEVD